MKVGDKVRSKPQAFTRVTGYVVRLDDGKPNFSPFAVVYCSHYSNRAQSVKIPQADLVVVEQA